MELWLFGGIIVHLIILGGSKSKTGYERQMENEEQMKWLMENIRKK